MCRMFAGQDPRHYAFRTRSIRLHGHSTSLRLEDRFWRLLDEIAEDQGFSTPKFIEKLHDEVEELRAGEGGARLDASNFTSLLRCACLVYLEEKIARGARAGAKSAA